MQFGAYKEKEDNKKDYINVMIRQIIESVHDVIDYKEMKKTTNKYTLSDYYFLIDTHNVRNNTCDTHFIAF